MLNQVIMTVRATESVVSAKAQEIASIVAAQDTGRMKYINGL